jgi:hypothetical protein
MNTPGGSDKNPPSVGASCGSIGSFGAGARAESASEGGVMSQDSPGSGTVGDRWRSIEISATEPLSVCANTVWIQTSAEATTHVITTRDARRVKPIEQLLATKDFVFIFLCTTEVT